MSVFSLAFGANDDALYLSGMGSTTDPAAGNGKQPWERFLWRDGKVERTGSAADDDIGQGLMETLAFTSRAAPASDGRRTGVSWRGDAWVFSA